MRCLAACDSTLTLSEKMSLDKAPSFHLRSAKFPVLEDEEEELVNEGTYGKALAGAS